MSGCVLSRACCSFVFLSRSRQNRIAAANPTPAAEPTAIPAMLPLESPEVAPVPPVLPDGDDDAVDEERGMLLVAVWAATSIVLNASQSPDMWKMLVLSRQQAGLSIFSKLSQQTSELSLHFTMTDPFRGFCAA